MESEVDAENRLDFWFDYTCPYAYLGFTTVERVAARMGAQVRLRPMLLGGVFAANQTPQRLFATLPPPKAAHNALDLERWSALLGVPRVTFPADHPKRSVEALRATLATSADVNVVRGFFRAYWVEGQAISSEPVMRRVLAEAGYDADRVLANAASQAGKDELRRQTDEAIALGIFGAPSYVHRGTMVWGQDRVHFLTSEPAGTLLDALSSPRRQETMTKHTLEFYWDFSSPFAYLGATQVRTMADRTGADLTFRPMLLGGLFKTIGQVDVPMLTWSDAKRSYYLEDLQRWAAYWGVPFAFPQKFPMSSIKALRAWLALPEERRESFMQRVFAAYWGDGRDISTDDVLADLIGDDAPAVLSRTQDPAIKQQLIDSTNEAVKRGVFGAPTYIVDSKDLYWGQDRFPLVERALRT